MVEDESRDFRLVEQTLKEAGLEFSMKRVDSEPCFIDALGTYRPSVILSDHGLPAFNGFAALAIAQERAPEIPFIFVTGSLGEEATIKALKNGATDFVLKHRLNSLAPAVRRALHHSLVLHQQRIAEREILRLNADLEKRVEERTSELEAANKELEAFSYSVSHDLRAPLRHMEGFIEILKATKSGQLDQESLGYLDVISQAATQMRRLIDDLLAFSRTARAELRKTRVRLNDLVRSVVQDVQRDAGDRKLAWRILHLPVVDADPALLRQVLFNLLCNAVKYTRPRPLARITIGSQTAPGEHVIFVRDNGVGFDMRYADKLFGVFQRLHRASEFEGTGIGLANVRRIVHRHGGRTWAEGHVDQGAAFYFSLPKGSLPHEKGYPDPDA